MHAYSQRKPDHCVNAEELSSIDQITRIYALEGAEGAPPVDQDAIGKAQCPALVELSLQTLMGGSKQGEEKTKPRFKQKHYSDLQIDRFKYTHSDLHWGKNEARRRGRNVAYSVIGIVPVADEDEELAIRAGIWQRDDDAVVDLDAAIATCSLEEASAREVEVGADLVLHLEEVCEVLARKDGAVRPCHSIFPGSPPLPYPIPVESSPA